MAKRGDSGILRLVVSFLRDRAQMTQAQFGRASRVAQPEVSKYEMGHVAPPEEALRRMAKVARIDWPLVTYLRQFYIALLSAANSDGSIPSTQALDLTILEPALLAVTPYLMEVFPREPARPSPEEERREAEQIWRILEKHSVQFRRRLIELSPRSGSWALSVRVCEESVRQAAHRPEEALDLADLALSIARKTPGEKSWRSRLEGYCWFHLANARRVANDFSGSNEAFARAWGLWRAGADESNLLAEWRLPLFEASLRRAERRFSEALALLDQARAASGGDHFATGRILLTREHVFLLMGDIQNALATLAEAAPFVEESGDRRLLFALRFKTAHNLYHLERYDEAARSLPQVRELAIQQANELDLLRVAWLAAKVAAGKGRTEEAIAGLEQVSRDFTARKLPFDAALSSLDLAELCLEDGRVAEVKELAVAMGWIFQAQGIDREALAALRLFCDAARQELATVELTQRVINEVKQVKESKSPGALCRT
jgi:transcriptional regulator with XRE-family HTH domain/tetratricopeptide (TPR) repeat protein